MNANPKHKLHAVIETSERKRPRWKSDAERFKLPLATVRGDKDAPRLPEYGHDALERLIGKRV